jgi:four helix bundle protein
MRLQSYRDLKVWQIGMHLAERVYSLMPGFPKQEAYGLCSQMQRAAISVPSNIAERHARDSTKEFLHHISIAFGSLAELETQPLLAQKLGYLPPNDAEAVLDVTSDLGRMLRGLQKSLKATL